MKSYSLPCYNTLPYKLSENPKTILSQSSIRNFATNYFNCSDFSQFNIGFPNVTKSSKEVEADVKKCLDYVCIQEGIPEDLKPSIVVIDSVQYAPTEEITARLRKAFPEKRLEADIFKNSDKQPKYMSQKEFLKYIAIHIKEPVKNIEDILEINNNNNKGFYSSYENTITYYTDGYRLGSESIMTTIKHEIHHVEEAIKRSSLTQEDRNAIISRKLLTNIEKGELSLFFKQLPTEENMTSVLMRAPSFNKQTRIKLAEFAKKNLFAADNSLYKKMEKYSALLEKESCDEKELEKAKADLGELAEKIENFAQNNKIEQETYSFNKSRRTIKDNKIKNKVLFDYLMSVEFRYQFFREKELKNVQTIKKPSEEFLKETEKAFDSHISTAIATFAMNIPENKSKTLENMLHWNYYSSQEEVNARINSEQYDIELLNTKLKNITDNIPEEDIMIMKKQLQKKQQQYKNDCNLKKYYDLKEKLNENPKNFILNYKYNIQKSIINNMKSNHIFTPFERFLLQTLFVVPLATDIATIRNIIKSKNIKAWINSYKNSNKVKVELLIPIIIINLSLILLKKSLNSKKE